MDLLPTEILGLIADNLGFWDSLSFRETCKTFNAVITPKLFSEWTVSHLPSSFENLRRTSSVPAFNNHISTLKYFGIVFEGVPRPVWQRNIRWPEGLMAPGDRPILPMEPTEEEALRFAREAQEWAMYCKPALHYEDDELDAGWEAFCDLNDAAQKLQGAGKILTRMLTGSFLKFPKLKNIELYTNKSRVFPDTCLSPFEKNLVSDGSLTELGGTITENLGISQVKSLLHSASAIPRRLESLKIDRLYCWLNLDTQALDLPISPIGRFADMMVNLKSLSLSISLTGATNAGDEDSSLKRLLSFAPNLEKFSLLLDVDHHRNPPEWFPQNEVESLHFDYLPGYEWTNLKELELGGFDCRPDVLLDILGQHAKRLKILKLDSIWLTSGTWRETFTLLKCLLSLDAFEVRGKFSALHIPGAMDDDTWVMSEGYPGITDVPLGEALASWFLGPGGPCPLSADYYVEFDVDG